MKKTLFVLALLSLSVQGFNQATKLQVPVIHTPVAFVETLSQTGSVPAVTDVWAPMVAPVNALVMSMAERGGEYDPQDATFMWNSLYYVIGLYGTSDWRTMEQGDYYLIPEEVVADYAYALFGNSEDLPPIPENLTEFVIYHEEEGNYLLKKGESSLTDSRLVHISFLEENRYEAQGEFYSLVDQSVLWEFTSVLVKNDSMFGYHIVDFSITPVFSQDT